MLQLRDRVRQIEQAAGKETNRAIAARVSAEQSVAMPAEVYVDQRDNLSPFNIIFLSGETEPPFHGATDSQLVEQMLLRYTRAGDRVVDLTAGIGTVADEARRMHRRCVSYDIIEPKLRDDIIVADARDLRNREERASAELIFFDPPLPDGFDYGRTYGNASSGKDLSLFDYPAYIEACGRIFMAAREVLHPGGTLIICAREFRHFDGHFFDTPAHLSGAARKAGLVFRDKFIAVLSPGRRASLLRSEGFRAGRANVSLNASTTALVFGRPVNDLEES
jgi:DNA modification methylase